jgi:hypothetical protein
MMVLAACGGETVVDESFRKDLELAMAASPITLQNTQAGTQVVSAVERTSPPAPRRIAASQRVARHTPAPRSRPAPVEVEEATVSEEVEPMPVEVRDDAIDVAPLPSPRPQPVASAGAGVDRGDIGSGRGDGIGTIIGVVLRGGHGGIDDCDPRVDGRRRGRPAIAINDRLPVIGTFPGGRIQGTFPGSGRLASSLPSGGRVRF